MKAKILIPLATLCLGFIPMLVMSILMKGFWINSQYDFPLVLIPAVLIGDSLFLPILNYRIYVALEQIIVFLKPKVIYITVASCLFLSFIVNLNTHYVWFHDKFTGFMDPKYGVYSAAGWWHFGFSTLQMAVIFVYTTLWVVTVKQQDKQMFKAFEKAIYIFMLFTIVNISGIFVNKDLVFFKRLTPDLNIISILIASMPLITAILLLSLMKKIHGSTQSNSYR